MKIFVIGTAHSAQHGLSGDTPELADQLNKLLRSHIAEETCDLVAEEMSREAMGRVGIAKTLPQEIAEAAGVPHLLADPTEIERRAAGIQENSTAFFNAFMFGNGAAAGEAAIQDQHRLREGIWLDRILQSGAVNVVFVCGEKHRAPFSELLNKHGWQVAQYSLC